MVNDMISDMLARIRNAQARSYVAVNVLHSRLCESVLDVLKKEGYINDFKTFEIRKGIKQIEVSLRYDKSGVAAIKKSWRISKPGRRTYKSCKELPKVLNGLGTCVISTSKGVFSDYEARNRMLGGEVLFGLY